MSTPSPMHSSQEDHRPEREAGPIHPPTLYPAIKMPVRRAEWIWRQRPAPPPGMAAIFGAARSTAEEANRFVYFRKGFDLPTPPQSALLHISADGRYQLFVNGVFVGRGPARCDPALQYYDTYATGRPGMGGRARAHAARADSRRVEPGKVTITSPVPAILELPDQAPQWMPVAR